MKNIYNLIFFATLTMLVSCGEDKQQPKIDNSPSISVIVNSGTSNNKSPFLTASGKIEAINSANLSTRIMGYVANIHVKVGDKVRKGQLLLSINNTDLLAKRGQINAGISEATIAFENAKKDYDRYTALFNDNSASQKEMDDQSANFNMAKARLELAKQTKNEINAQFAYANIKAPFDGVITNKFINLGDLANPGIPLLEVEAPNSFHVVAMISENEISQIQLGAKVSVLVKSLTTTITGKVTEVSTSAKSTGGQYFVKITLDKTDKKILSGMFTSVQFPVAKTKQMQNRVFVAKEALIYHGQLSGIYTVSQSNTALLRWLRLGRTYGQNVEVLSGLTADEQYIISAKSKLYNGAKINIQ